ncbi:hypothetical protein RD110_01605 [Rhodoferax koreense]|uniref:Uncharacterized protein n=1 Tax=Rhodoferax koreensis TaxID=1842727 RepID=A0A1P8JQM5_9BURK|nr:ankyrin repeat domain-containing protein [Rhodoferax koreense]APW36062.1 hypothetical protein RD110_01605 [Rhodoferax koreense]
MTAPRPPQDPWLEPEPAADELLRRYHQASAADPRRPASHVRDAVRAHANAVLAAGPATAPAKVAAAAASAVPARPAANLSRWKLSLLASVALAGLTGLLVLQFDREPTETRTRVLGEAAAPATPAQTMAPTAPVAPAEPAPRAAPAPALRSEKKQSEVARTPKPAAPPTTAQAQAQAQADGVAAQQKSAAAELAPPPPEPAPSAMPAPEQATAAPVAPSALSHTPLANEMSRDDEGDPQQPRRAALISTLPLASALQEAARTGRASQINRLLARGAPLDAADPAGHTPLMLATIHNHAAVVQRLLAAGAKVGLVDRRGMTALQHARQLKRERIAELIEEAS